MVICRNPTPETIQLLIANSNDDAAKWIKDLDTGDTYYWPSHSAFHANIAKSLHIDNYDKGIAIT